MQRDKLKAREKNPIEKLFGALKLDYITGKSPINASRLLHGLNPTKNSSLNFGHMLKIPYDPEMRIRKNDPAAALRANNSRIGQIERFVNVYANPRVKFAD